MAAQAPPPHAPPQPPHAQQCLRLLLFTDLSLVRSVSHERVAAAAERACDVLCCALGVPPACVAASSTLLDSRFNNDSLEVVPQLRQAAKARGEAARALLNLN